MRIEDLKKDYDKLQVKYGAKELDSIYNGGCEEKSFPKTTINWARWIYGNSCINPYKIKIFLK